MARPALSILPLCIGAVLLLSAPTILQAGSGAAGPAGPLPTVVELAPVPDGGRWMHSAEWDGAHGLYAFGGSTYDKPQSFNKSNALLHFDLPSNTWRMEQTTGPWPDARARAGFASLANGTFIVAAGNGGTGLRRCLSDTWNLRQDPITRAWTAEQSTTTSLPFVGDAVIVGMLNKTVAGFFPGGCEEQEYRSVFELGFGSPDWIRYPWGLGGPRGRTRHVAVADGSGSTVFYWGGFPNLEAILPSEVILWARVWAYDARTHQWSMLTDGTSGPSDRFYPTAVFDNVSNQVLMFGGNFVFTSQSHLYGDLWALDPADHSWKQLMPDTPELARTQAAGAYCPCEGGMVVTGGRNTPVGQRGSAETSTMLVRVEHPVDATWVNPKARGDRRLLRINWRGAGDRPPALLPESIALQACQSGEVLARAERVEQVSAGSWIVHVIERDWDQVDQLALKGGLTVTGSIEGDNIKFLGRVGPRPGVRLESESLQSIERTAVAGLKADRTGPGQWLIAWDQSSGQVMKLDVFDVQGRRVSSSSPGATTTVVNIGTRKAGIYFARLEFGSGKTQSIRLVNLPR